MFKNTVFEKVFLAQHRKTMEKANKLELLPKPAKNKMGIKHEGILDVVRKTVTVSKDEFKKPQEWMEQLTRLIESAFSCKSECIAATPPIIRHTDPSDLNSQMEITSIVIDVSDVMKKEGLCQ